MLYTEAYWKAPLDAGQALEDRVKVAVQTACQQQTSKIKADLEVVSRRLSSASVDPDRARNNYNLRTADDLEATLRRTPTRYCESRSDG